MPDLKLQEDVAQRKANLSRPQPWGVLPTLAFWRRPDVWRHAKWFVVPCLLLWTYVIQNLWRGLISWWASTAIYILAVGIGLGLFERYIRRKLRQRHKAIATGDVARPELDLRGRDA
ncbi:hypothetical protein [Nannocystis sp. SCPEA4]|uniref:hypothetical protein n=1 Tax=Nannocystis sp. SCPEA4 TaxID=2996787 RepID=UPI0022707286|nr:hypothetical protein [Nannocystis sp. SCPEA4]MCY1060602.1 hypothetical protein [Nannocystis sp. SCPEA4]